MADMQTALVARVIAAVGHDRVHWTIVPEDAPLPYVRMQVVTDLRPQHLKNYDRARQSRVQVDCLAKTYAAARAAAEAIIAGVADPAEIDGVRFGRTAADGPRDLGEDTPKGFVHRLSLDLLTEHSMA